jgi:hypothetical protein
VSPETRERQKAAKRAHRYREVLRTGGKLGRDERRWYEKYERQVKPGRPRNGAPNPMPPKLESSPDPARPAVEIHHLDERRALPPHVAEAKQTASDEKPPVVTGTILCKVCGRAEPCAVHPRGAEPFAPAVDVPDPNADEKKASEEKRAAAASKAGARMKGLVAMGAALLKGVGAELRAAGKWYAYPDEMVDEFWVPHAEDTAGDLAAAVQEMLGISDKTISGVVTFGVPVLAVVAVRSVRAESEKKNPAERDQAARAAADQARAQASKREPITVEATPAPAPDPAPNGAQSPKGSRVHLEPEISSVEDEP